jgi:hypothetical protein
MKKVFCILAGLTLMALLAACDLSSMFKKKDAQEPPPAATATEPAAGETATTEPPPSAEPVPEPKPKPRPSTTTTEPPVTPPPPVAPPPVQADETTTVPPPRVKRAGLGVIFIGNIEQGQFRVKADNELMYELAFSGKETRATKELLLEPGQHLMKFVVIDAKGVRGVKEETMNFAPGRHQTVRVSVKDTPGAIIMEHLE